MGGAQSTNSTQVEKECATAKVSSSSKGNATMFNNPESFPDMELVIRGLESPLLLHKGIMADKSKLMKRLLDAKRSDQSADANKIEWPLNTDQEVDRTALVKALRLCYGDKIDVCVDDREICAVFAALCQLEVTCLDEELKQLTALAVKQAKNDPIVGVRLLNETRKYSECCNGGICKLDLALARVVFTEKNFREHSESVVIGCLMKLPSKYLDVAEYGKSHSEYSEFSMRARFVKEAVGLTDSEKREIMKKCDLTKLNGDEIKELRSLGVLQQDELIDLLFVVLKQTEKEKEELEETARKEQEECDANFDEEVRSQQKAALA